MICSTEPQKFLLTAEVGFQLIAFQNEDKFAKIVSLLSFGSQKSSAMGLVGNLCLFQ